MKQTTPAPGGEAGKAAPLSNELRAKITERADILRWMETAKVREMELRRELAKHFVPKPKEGTNTVQGQGFAVKVGHTITRSLDDAALDAVMPQMPEDYRVVGNLIEYKPRFKLDVYRQMPDDVRRIFEQALTIKEDGAPTLEIVFDETQFRPSDDNQTAVSSSGTEGRKNSKPKAKPEAKKPAPKASKPAPAAKPAKRKK